MVPLFEHLHAKCSALAELFGEYVTTISMVRGGAIQAAYQFRSKTDSFVPADVREALQQDLLNPDDLREIVLEFRLNFFKKTTKPFDVANAVRFEFNRYNYAVKWSNRQPDLSKLYGTALTDSETDQVTAELVRYLIAAIKQLTASAA